LLKILFYLLSATFPPHVSRYAVKLLSLQTLIPIITIDGRCENINILVAAKPPGRDIQPLHDLIPEDITDISSIPKTIIFVDSVLMARNIARSLRRVL
jgi:hypothetical protein